MGNAYLITERTHRTILAPLAQRHPVAPPLPLVRLVGRERELARACALLRDPEVRLLTLTGPGGIGKTRLALAIAAELAEERGSSTAWVALAPIRDPVLVLPAIAAALGISDAPAHALADNIRVALLDRPMLLVIDNVEQVLPAAPELAGLLAVSPALKILATSRAPLRLSGEHILQMSSLSMPASNAPLTPETVLRSEAGRLFVERASAASIAFSLTERAAAVVARICQQLDGLPLAIELAAARAHQLPLEILSERLESRLPLLTGGARDAPERHQTMRNAIAWSEELLTPAEQALFRRLAVFPGGCTLAGAESVVRDEPEAPSFLLPATAILDGLTSLVDKSLLTPERDADGTPRFRMLETIREFALEQLDASGEASVLWRAHADALLAQADQHPLESFYPSDRLWLGRLDVEHANLRAVMAWLDQHGDTERLSRLAAAVAWFWFVRSHLQEGRATLERALTTGGLPTSLRTKMTVVLGLIVLVGGTFEQVTEQVERELVAARAAQNWLGAAQLLIVLGVDATTRGAYLQATIYLDDALALATTLEDPGLRLSLTSIARGNLGVIYRGQGRLAEAETAFEAAREGLRATDPVRGELLALGDLGDIARDRGNDELARTRYRDALTLAWQYGNQRAIIEGLESVAYLAVAGDQPHSAVRLLAAAERLRKRSGMLGRFPMSRAAWEQAIVTARTTLAHESFTATWSDGSVLETGEAVAEAIDVLEAPTAPKAPPGSLTPRERQVLELIVAGLSDRAIGEALFISTRTVETHVAHIFEKLGVRARTAAVTAALTAGLLDRPLPDPPAGPD